MPVPLFLVRYAIYSLGVVMAPFSVAEIIILQLTPFWGVLTSVTVSVVLVICHPAGTVKVAFPKDSSAVGINTAVCWLLPGRTLSSCCVIGFDAGLDFVSRAWAMPMMHTPKIKGMILFMI